MAKKPIKGTWTHMRYPDGQIMNEGDLVWFDEGASVAFIHNLIESRKDFESWGLEPSSPRIMFTSWHPYCPDDMNGYFCQAAEDSEDEGVSLLTKHERSELQWAIDQARSEIPPPFRDHRFSVNALMNMKTGREEWHLEFVDSSSPENLMKPVASAVVPFRPNTRD